MYSFISLNAPNHFVCLDFYLFDVRPINKSASSFL